MQSWLSWRWSVGSLGVGVRAEMCSARPMRGGCRRSPAQTRLFLPFTFPPTVCTTARWPRPSAMAQARGSLDPCVSCAKTSSPSPLSGCVYARAHDHPSHPQVISRSAATMADAVTCTGETLSFSPSTTNPTLTDDSVSASITGKYNAVTERVAGGNAAAAPAASCPIDERKGNMGGPRPSSKRPALFPS